MSSFGLTLKGVYGLKDEYARGRLGMLLSTSLAGTVNNLAGGLFFTSFLLMYGLDKSKIGILIFIPYLASLLNIFSPVILERFERRKTILVSAKLLYYFVNIICITIMPMVILDHKARLICFVTLVTVANCVNQLFVPGFTAWQANFLQERYRVDYFNSSCCILNIASCGLPLLISLVGDRLIGTEYELIMLVSVRFFAFFLAILDCAIWIWMKEYPYIKEHRTRFSNIFVLPFRNKKFLLTMLFLGAHNVAYFLPNATIFAYVLEDMGVSYSLYNGINTMYFLFFVFFSGFWKRFIAKRGWFRSFSAMVLMVAGCYAVHMFTVSTNIWLFVTIRMIMHFVGVLLNAVVSSLVYVNLPKADRTNYLAFYTIIHNFSIFLGMAIGSMSAAMMGDQALVVAGMGFTSTQLMFLLGAVGNAVIAAAVLACEKKLQPDPELAE